MLVNLMLKNLLAIRKNFLMINFNYEALALVTWNSLGIDYEA